MKYTDKELIRASQIAYFTINNDVIRDAAAENISEIYRDLSADNKG